MNRWMLVVFALSFTSLLPRAWASNPDVTVAEDGSITARMVISAPAESVRQAVQELQHASSDNVLELRFRPDGECQSVFRKTRGLWNPLTMRTRLCPTADGWREMLVQSDDYTDYESEWTIRHTDTGDTEMALRVRTAVNLAVPVALVRRGTIDGVRKTFARVSQKVAAPRQAE